MMPMLDEEFEAWFRFRPYSGALPCVEKYALKIRDDGSHQLVNLGSGEPLVLTGVHGMTFSEFESVSLEQSVTGYEEYLIIRTRGPNCYVWLDEGAFDVTHCEWSRDPKEVRKEAFRQYQATKCR